MTSDVDNTSCDTNSNEKTSDNSPLTTALASHFVSYPVNTAEGRNVFRHNGEAYEEGSCGCVACISRMCVQRSEGAD